MRGPNPRFAGPTPSKKKLFYPSFYPSCGTNSFEKNNFFILVAGPTPRIFFFILELGLTSNTMKYRELYPLACFGEFIRFNLLVSGRSKTRDVSYEKLYWSFPIVPNYNQKTRCEDAWLIWRNITRQKCTWPDQQNIILEFTQLHSTHWYTINIFFLQGVT